MKEAASSESLHSSGYSPASLYKQRAVCFSLRRLSEGRKVFVLGDVSATDLAAVTGHREQDLTELCSDCLRSHHAANEITPS